jgi:glycosyltransferase involved in cell wall biosynthesis
VTPGGTPAEGRNCGARKATGYRLLFLDADVRIDQEFIRLSIERMVETNVGAASFGFKVSGHWSLKLIHKVAELYFFLTSSCGNPHGIGGAIMIRRDLHDSIGGFDPTVAVGEDHEYLKRASKKTGYRFFLSPRVTVSTRRFQRRGIITMSLLWLRIEFHRLFLGEVRDDRFRYFD